MGINYPSPNRAEIGAILIQEFLYSNNASFYVTIPNRCPGPQISAPYVPKFATSSSRAFTPAVRASE